MSRNLFRTKAFQAGLIGFSLMATAALAAPMELEVGESRTLGEPTAIKQVLIGTAGVVTTKAPDSRRLTLTGDRPGLTAVTLVTGGGRDTYEVRVLEAGTRMAQDVKRQMGAYPGLQDVVVEKKGEAFVLSGVVADTDSHTRAITLAKTITGADVTDLIQITGRQMVAVDVRFVAISDTTLKALGFNFSKLGQGFEYGLFAPTTLNTFSGGGGNPLNITATEPLSNAFNLLLNDRKNGALAVISALSDAGLSQVIAQPTLMARSGEKAEFLAGGEVPIPVPQGGTASGAITIEYREYGVKLSVEPFVMSDNRIVLKLAPEVSELDYTNRVSIQGFNIPGFRRRSASTTVELGDGQSFVIAGLTFASSSQNESKVPGLGNLPVLGTFFKTAQNSREKLELIIIATPRLISPMSAKEAAALTPEMAPPGPSFTDIILNTNSAESRAARFGLSR
jgi:pilus assembly protein CpaC